MKHVFLSYVREDSSKIEPIRLFLEAHGVKVWTDKKSLKSGFRWKYAIEHAIRDGAFFLACFSAIYQRKGSTYMNEELIVAIEQLRLMPYNRAWFIPVRLTDCEIPDRPIGAGESLTDLQWIDLFDDLRGGLQRLAEIIVPVVSPPDYVIGNFMTGLHSHIHNRIRLFEEKGLARSAEVESRWLRLLQRERLAYLGKTFFEVHQRSKSLRRHELEEVVEPGDNGDVLLLSVTPDRDILSYIESLTVEASATGVKYIDFVLEQRRRARVLRN